MTLTFGSLFAGIGGLELALEAHGMATAWQVENDAYASAVLERHWPGVPNLGDITSVDWNTVEPVDVLTGGFPCQDISYAGKGAGITDGTRSGLWSYFADAIGILRPRYVFVENVAALAVRGLDRVTADLASMGYVGRTCALRAADVGAPHRRERIFLIAAGVGSKRRGERSGLRSGNPAGNGRRHAGDNGGQAVTDPGRLGVQRRSEHRSVRGAQGEGIGQGLQRKRGRNASGHGGEAPADTNSGGLGVSSEQHGQPAEAATDWDPRRGHTDGLGDQAWGDYEPAIRRWEANTGPAPRPTDDRGRLAPEFVEWLMGFPVGWTEGIPRTQRLKCLGNAVVPMQGALAWSLLCREEVAA